MQRIIARSLGLMLLLWTAVGLPELVLADDPNQAGLVVQFGDGRIETICVPFEDHEITGANLLLSSGLELSVDASSGMGITVCQIQGEGCAYPAEHCFCQCMSGGECAYWNYLYRDPSATDWTYSPLGAVLRKVSHGSVEAWVWGDGSSPPAGEWTFEAICLLPTPAPTEMPASPAVAPVTATAATTKTEGAAPSPTAPPRSTAPPPSPTPQADSETGPGLGSYWPFAVMVLGLGVVVVIVWLRR